MRTSVEKSTGWLRGIQIGLGIITVILSIYALAFPAATALIVTIFVGIGLIFNGCARIVEGISGKHSGWAKLFLWCRYIVNSHMYCCTGISSVWSSICWTNYSNWVVDNRNSNDCGRSCRQKYYTRLAFDHLEVKLFLAQTFPTID
jgi:hypothetical protein